LTAAGIYVGGYSGAGPTNGSGAISQSGGTITTATLAGFNLFVGYGAGSSGAYTMSGGSLVLNGDVSIGNDGTGNFTQNGGSVTMPGKNILDLGIDHSGTGNYTLNSGTLTVSGGLSDEFVGENGTGTFTQTGGAHVLRELFVGFYPGAIGTYTLSGTGALSSSGNEYVGREGDAVFNQSGGTNTISSGSALNIGASGLAGDGAYYLSGGIVSAPNVNVGANSSGVGVFNVSGTGTLSVANALTVYNGTGYVVGFSGGTINAGGLNFNGNPSLFNWTGGTLNLTSNVTWDSAAAGTSTGAAFGSALTLGSGQTLMITGNEGLGGTGPFSLTLNSGSSHYVTGTLTLNPTGTLTQNAGSTLYAATIVQAGGTINGTLQNQGAFTYQSGQFNGRLLNQGTISFAPSFTVGDGLENDTSITLAAGQTLVANGNDAVNNFGQLIFSGGTISGSVPLINAFGGTIQGQGAVNLTVTNDGTISVNGLLSANIVGNYGLVQGSGTLAVGTFGNDALGTVVVAAGKSLAITSGWPNAGLVVLQGQTARLGGGAITNTGSIQGLGLINSNVANTGTIEALGGTLSFGGTLTNPAGGLIRAGTGSKVLVTHGLSTNSGIINLIGGTFDNGGNPLNNTGQISGFGIFATGGTGLDNHGSITFSGGLTTVNGPVTNENGQTITVIHNPAIFTGPVTNVGMGTFNVTDATATFAGGFINAPAAQFSKAGSGTAQVNTVPTLDSASALAVGDSGTLRFQPTSGAASVGTGVSATISSSATLELAGTVSSLSSGSNRVNITNNSTAPAGVLVSGTNQQVGNIDGSGTTQVNAGSDLTANHIIQSALVIGGTPSSHGLVTIDASDALGNSLAQPTSNDPAFDASFAAGGATSLADLPAPNAEGFSGDPIPARPIAGNASQTSVPEPPSLFLVGLAVAFGMAARKVLRRQPSPLE
jgi:hypothetical protein